MQEINVYGTCFPIKLTIEDLVQVSRMGYNRLFLPDSGLASAQALKEQCQDPSDQEALKGLSLVGVQKLLYDCRLKEALMTK